MYTFTFKLVLFQVYQLLLKPLTSPGKSLWALDRTFHSRLSLMTEWYPIIKVYNPNNRAYSLEYQIYMHKINWKRCKNRIKIYFCLEVLQMSIRANASTSGGNVHPPSGTVTPQLLNRLPLNRLNSLPPHGALIIEELRCRVIACISRGIETVLSMWQSVSLRWPSPWFTIIIYCYLLHLGLP